MALKLDLIKTEQNFDGELIFKGGYWKIDCVVFSKDLAVINLGVYTLDKAEKLESKVFSYTPSLTKLNVLEESYMYLKSLPEFLAAEDI